MAYRTKVAVALAFLFPIACFAQTPAGPAQAGNDPRSQPINPDRPGIADGSTVVGDRVFQIEFGAQYENHDAAGATDRAWFVPLLLRYGIGKKWEARFETSGIYSWEQTNAAGIRHTSSGVSPLSIGAKYQIQDSDGPRHPSIGAIGRVFPASGSGDFASNVTSGDLRLSADWDMKKWQPEANLGVGVYDNGTGGTFTCALAAGTLGYVINDQTGVFVDFGLQSPEAPHGKTALVLDTGVTYLLNKDTQLDFSVGTGVSGQSVPHPFIAAGISWRRF